jgi:putative FmdB family regulatory protein
MPIYEYQCAACGHYLETLQKISDPPLTDCHKCGKPALKKLISAAAFRLKGGGWYETDFKTGDRKNVAQADKQSKSGDKSKGKANSDSTSAKKKTTGNS